MDIGATATAAGRNRTYRVPCRC